MRTLDKSFVYRKFKATLVAQKGREEAERIWQAANIRLTDLRSAHSDLDADSRMMILPAAAIYLASPDTLPLLREHAAATGRKFGRVVHSITTIPGVSKLLWRNMPQLMRHMSSPEKGYSRMIVSETAELVGVDILACPLHDAAVRLGVPEVASVICVMDNAYMTGFKYIDYTRTTAIGEGDSCCDYRLRFDRRKK